MSGCHYYSDDLFEVPRGRSRRVTNQGELMYLLCFLDRLLCHLVMTGRKKEKKF